MGVEPRRRVWAAGRGLASDSSGSMGSPEGMCLPDECDYNEEK